MGGNVLGALAHAAERLRGALAGLLTERAGGVTEAGLRWAVDRVRTDLERDGGGS